MNVKMTKKKKKYIKHYGNVSLRNWILVVFVNKVPQFGFEKEKS